MVLALQNRLCTVQTMSKTALTPCHSFSFYRNTWIHVVHQCVMHTATSNENSDILHGLYTITLNGSLFIRVTTWLFITICCVLCEKEMSATYWLLFIELRRMLYLSQEGSTVHAWHWYPVKATSLSTFLEDSINPNQCEFGVGQIVICNQWFLIMVLSP